MSNWADELRTAFDCVETGEYGDLSIDEMCALVATGERQLEHALNTVECLVEANAALREQLCALKAERGAQKRTDANAELMAKVVAEDKLKAKNGLPRP